MAFFKYDFIYSYSIYTSLKYRSLLKQTRNFSFSVTPLPPQNPTQLLFRELPATRGYVLLISNHTVFLFTLEPGSSSMSISAVHNAPPPPSLPHRQGHTQHFPHSTRQLMLQPDISDIFELVPFYRLLVRGSGLVAIKRFSLLVIVYRRV